MNFKYKKAIVKHKGKEYAICIPEYDFTKNTFLNELNTKDFYLASPNTDLKEFAKAMQFISQNKDIILYIPLSKNICPLLCKDAPSLPPQLDMVCVNHSIQFQQKEWRKIRNRIKDTKEKFIYKFDKNELEEKDWFHFIRRENKDLLDLYNNYSTLILTSSSKAYQLIAFYANDLSKCNYTNSGLEHDHLDELFKWKNKWQEWREVTLYLIDKIENYQELPPP